MIRSDNHVHTNFSSDSKTSVEEMIQRGIALGLSSICFTDHIDYGFPSEKYGMDFLFDVEKYFQTLHQLSEKHSEISIRTGVELGLKSEIFTDAAKLIQEYPFDFVIGSTHLVNDYDPYYREYWEAYGEREGIRLYYESTYNNIAQGLDFDVYGHIDYIIRYTPTIKEAKKRGKTDEAYYKRIMKDNWEIISEILYSLIHSNKGIEINTGGFKALLGHPNPHEDILKRYQELGGEIITVGSDAHDTKYLGYAFRQVPDILKKCGFSSYTEFKDRKPFQVPLN